MRRLPTYTAAFFLAITLVRVATFSAEAMHAGKLLGTFFSIGLGTAVFLSSYNMRKHASNKDGTETAQSINVQKAALVALLFFGVVDGLFNLWEVQRSVKDEALKLAAFVYGVFPTLAAALLGWLQGRLDKLPVPPQKKRAPYSFSTLLLVAASKMLRIDEDTLTSAAAAASERDSTSGAQPVITVLQPDAPAQLNAPAEVHENAYAAAASGGEVHHAEAVQIVQQACKVAGCNAVITGESDKQVRARMAAHVRWQHSNAEVPLADNLHTD